MKKRYKNGNAEILIDGTNGFKEIIVKNGGTYLPEFPDSLIIKITNHCELKCLYCPVCHNDKESFFKHSSLNEIIKIIDGINYPITIGIDGGDIFSYPDIFNFLAYAKKKGFITYLFFRESQVYNNLDIFLKTKNFYDSAFMHVDVIDADKIKKYVCVSEDDVKKTYFTNVLGISDFFKISELQTKFANSKFLIRGYKFLNKKIDLFNEDVLKNLYLWKSYLETNDLEKENIYIDSVCVFQIGYEASKKYKLIDFEKNSLYFDAVNYAFSNSMESSSKISAESIGLMDYYKLFASNKFSFHS